MFHSMSSVRSTAVTASTDRAQSRNGSQVGVIVPRRAQHDGAEGRPIDGVVVPADDRRFRELGEEQREVGVERPRRRAR